MTDVTASKRISKRTPLFLHGQLETASRIQDVRLRDISFDGALLDAEHTFEAFEPITLICGHSRINGSVVWSEDGRTGVAFSEPVTGKSLTDSFRNKLRVSAPRNYRAFQKGEALSEDQMG